MMARMDEQEAPAPEADERSPFERFQQLTRALFRVDRRDVDKHQPTRRAAKVPDEPRPAD